MQVHRVFITDELHLDNSRIDERGVDEAFRTGRNHDIEFYYVAACDCGWRGDTHSRVGGEDGYGAASKDAKLHARSLFNA